VAEGDMHIGFWLEREKKRHHLEDPDVVGRIVLKGILEK
jgi:hypothetical protein